MCYLKIITLENLILSFATAFGWLIALVIAIIHLSGARSDNQAALEYEIRKKIEIETFKDVNRAVDELSSKIGSVSNVFLSLPINYKSHKENPLIVKFDKIQLSQEIMHKGVELLKTYADFILSIESNEIAVIEFDHYRKYIQFQIEDFKELIRKFEIEKILGGNFLRVWKSVTD